VIPTFDYLSTLPELEEEVLDAVRRVLRSGRLVLGPETEAFEVEFAAWLGSSHCVAVSSGTAALQAALMALGTGPGDEVLTVANTCAPTVAAIRLTGARPTFVDVAQPSLLMDPELVAAAVSERTRCVLPVHLWGDVVDVPRLRELLGPALRERVVEDCAQAHGARLAGRPAGTMGRLGAFSSYPTKNLGAYGDAGAVVTDDPELAASLRRVRMYGYDGSPSSTCEGANLRINEIQAAILRVKLRRLDGWLARRRALAARYQEQITHPGLTLPPRRPQVEHAYHQYVLRCPDRAAITRALDAAQVGWGIHYPTPVHQMPAYQRFAPAGGLPVTEAAAERVLSLPLHEALSDEQAARVVATLNAAG
jgi:dTDP-3-amino-2,3,6-trideoxy-4-keto-D-glucose/dTDP-3-amino-3,4,6-trideoxy-alpha-D-glucose/dTDP-2,6-dideoxy-D-kanosamine transaminase